VECAAEDGGDGDAVSFGEALGHCALGLCEEDGETTRAWFF
jgi:hypothetical protein